MAEKVLIKPKAAEVEFEIFLGDTLEYSFSWLDEALAPLPLSAYTALLQLKLDKTSGTSVVQLTEGAGITLADAKPNISFEVSAAEVLTLQINTPYFYDLQLTSAGGVVTTILTGTIVALQDNSR